MSGLPPDGTHPELLPLAPASLVSPEMRPSTHLLSHPACPRLTRGHAGRHDPMWDCPRRVMCGTHPSGPARSVQCPPAASMSHSPTPPPVPSTSPVAPPSPACTHEGGGMYVFGIFTFGCVCICLMGSRGKRGHPFRADSSTLYPACACVCAWVCMCVRV